MKKEITLQKAHKLLNEAKRLLSITRSKSYDFNNVAIVSVATGVSFEKFNQKIEEKKEIYKSVYKRVLLLNRMVSTLKKEIFQKNVETGISDLMEEISMFKNELNLMSDFIIQNVNDTTLKKEDITEELFNNRTKFSEDKLRDHISFTVLLTEFENFETDKTTIKKKIVALEDKKTELNAKTKITIEIDDELAKEFYL